MMIAPIMLGRIGQSAVERWAAQASITANASHHDERGWDVLLQVSGGGTKGALDRAPPQLSCMVQVKTTMTDKSSEPITLANWWRMCTDPIPWFVVIVHVGADLEPDAAHLVHVDERWCAVVLRRLRELGEAERANLGRHTISVTWSDAERLSELHGRELLRRLRQHTGEDQHAYVQQKMAWYRDVGYEDRARRINLTFAVRDRAEFWRGIADLGAGLRSIVPGEWRAEVRDVRFGIEATLHEISPDAGDMEFRTPSLGEVALQLTSSLGDGPPVRCDLYWASAVFPFIPPEYDKIRLASEHMTCVLASRAGPDGPRRVGEFAFQLPQDTPVTFGSLASVAPTMRLMANHSACPVTVRITAANGAAIELAPASGGEVDAADLEFIETVTQAVAVCAWFETPPEIEIVVAGLDEQRQAVQFMNRVRESEQTDPLAEAPFEGPYREVVPLGETFAATTECGLQLLDRALVCFVGVYGAVTACEEVPGFGARVHMQRANVIVERLTVINPSTEAEREELERQLDRLHAAVLHRLAELGCTRISNHRDPATRRTST